MRAYAVSSALPAPADAVVDVAASLRARGFQPGKADSTALVFATWHHGQDGPALCAALEDALGTMPFLGWLGGSAFHGLRMQEREPGLVVLILEDVPGYVRSSAQTGLGSQVAAELLADAPVGRVRLLSAPSTQFDPQNLLPCLDEQSALVAGGLSVAPQGNTATALAPGATSSVTALLSLSGVQAVLGVAQGARHLGEIRQVTRAEGNRIMEVDGRPALQALILDLPPPLQQQLRSLWGILYAGLGGPEDLYVMRNVVGIDPATGSVAIAGPARVGQKMVYALRDGGAARSDLETTLISLQDTLEGRKPLAVLLFSCVARDANLFDVKCYDAGRCDDMLGGDDIPVVGFAGAGEVGTFGATSMLFGYSAVITVLLAEDA